MFLLVALERFEKGLEGPCYSEDPGSEDLGLNIRGRDWGVHGNRAGVALMQPTLFHFLFIC